MTLASHNLRSARRAFTLLEILLSVLIIGVLISLLFVVASAARKSIARVADQRMVESLRTGAVQFKDKFAFSIPLVKDQVTAAGSGADTRARLKLDTSTNERGILVYSTSVPADVTALTVPTIGPDPDNPLQDNRYSEQSLPYYLFGALEAAVMSSGQLNTLPIDGVSGVGFYKPTVNGTFEIPTSVRAAAATGSTARNRGSEKFEPFAELGSSMTLLPVRASGTAEGVVTLNDRNGVPIRYYKWLPAAASPTDQWATYRSMPPIVGRDSVNQIPGESIRAERDFRENTALRNASWAIVAAGPNKAFGDEPVAELARIMGASIPADSAETIALRRKAELDNVVEVGE